MIEKRLGRKEGEIWGRAGGLGQSYSSGPGGKNRRQLEVVDYHCVRSSIWVFVWIIITSADHVPCNKAKGNAHAEKRQFKSILLVLAFIFSKLKKICLLFMRIIFFWIYLKGDYIL